jgi:hypothetical protein
MTKEEVDAFMYTLPPLPERTVRINIFSNDRYLYVISHPDHPDKHEYLLLDGTIIRGGDRVSRSCLDIYLSRGWFYSGIGILHKLNKFG